MEVVVKSLYNTRASTLNLHPVMERLKLMHERLERNFSNTTNETITRIIEELRINHGHDAAEAKAKEIRELIETGISEAELLKILKQMT